MPDAPQFAHQRFIGPAGKRTLLDPRRVGGCAPVLLRSLLQRRPSPTANLACALPCPANAGGLPT
jgi:hypothetical protein